LEQFGRFSETIPVTLIAKVGVADAAVVRPTKRGQIIVF
jgi:hypothetical protein